MGAPASPSILHVVHGYPPAQIGGTEIHVETLVRVQSGTRRVHVFHREQDPTRPTLDLKTFALPSGQRWSLNVPPRWRRDFRELWFRDDTQPAFQRALETLQPDIVHVHLLTGLGLGFLAMARAFGARVIMTLHDHGLSCGRGQRIRPDLDLCREIDRTRCARCLKPGLKDLVRGRNPLGTAARIVTGRSGAHWLRSLDGDIREALTQVDAFVAPSHSSASLFAEFAPDLPRATVIPHGMAPGLAVPERSQPKRPWHVGFLGALTTTKGLHVLGQAATLLSSKDFRFSAFGTKGPRALTPPPRLLRRLELHAPRPPQEVPNLLASLDVLVVPSLWEETFGLVLHEAWRARLPAVVSKIGALAEAAGQDERALTFPAGDHRALAERLLRLDDDLLYKRLTGPFVVRSDEDMAQALYEVYGVST